MRRLAALCVIAAACGPGGDQGPAPAGDAAAADGAITPDARPTATVRGRVWAPGQALGVAAPGEEIPVFAAAVYVSAERPPPIPDHVYCDRCAEAPHGAVWSSHDGSFALPNVAAGTHWLVIQKGQFRLEQPITVAAGETLELAPAQTTLPSVHDPDHGAWIPRIAVALGTHDTVEDVLGKIGLGALDDRFALRDPLGEIDLYDNGYPQLDTLGDLSALLLDLDRLERYHVLFFPCSTRTTSSPVVRNPTALANLRRYVHDGGKLYVTDWSGEIADRPFPPQIELGGAGTDSRGSYDPVALTGEVTTWGHADGDFYDSPDGQVVDADMSAWLGLQMGPTPDDATPGLYDPDRFRVASNWNWIQALHDVPLGTDGTGAAVVDRPKAWVVGSDPELADGARHPLSVTYEPTGCGRVLFSTYQTANGHHPGLYPQERLLLYLIMEIGVCSSMPEPG